MADGSRHEQHDAFEALAAAYRLKVYRLSYSILGDHGLAEDAAQETMLRAWRALDTHKGESSLSTWIFSIARNTALSLRVRQKRAEGVPLHHVAEPAWLPQPLADPELARAIAALPDSYRQAIVLFHMEERSYDEAARMLGLPLGTFKTHLHRGRALLAEALSAPPNGAITMEKPTTP